MTLIHDFIATEEFFDDTHFPHGFRKSGDFSIAEAVLLANIGKRLLVLEQGLCKPETPVEEQFVHMCQAQLKGQTKVEILWQKYKALTQHKTFHCLNGHT